MKAPCLVRPATDGDWPAIWAALEPMIRAGETYALPRDLAEGAARAYWTNPLHSVFVAEREGAVLGTYFLRANALGEGDQVANCGYVTAPNAKGQGIARQMCLHSLDEAGRRGFQAMQFNFVVSSNAAAVHLWAALGFREIGRIPQGFAHPRLGLVDALILYRRVSE